MVVKSKGFPSKMPLIHSALGIIAIWPDRWMVHEIVRSMELKLLILWKLCYKINWINSVCDGHKQLPEIHPIHYFFAWRWWKMHFHHIFRCTLHEVWFAACVVVQKNCVVKKKARMEAKNVTWDSLDEMVEVVKMSCAWFFVSCATGQPKFL